MVFKRELLTTNLALHYVVMIYIYNLDKYMVFNLFDSYITD